MRIKITENQFNNLVLEEITEGIFSKLVVGNILKFTTGGDEMMFQVTFQDGNSIFLRNMNKGSVHTAFTYILPKSEKLDDNNISLLRFKTDTESPSDKKGFRFNNVTKVDVLDANGELKHSYTVGSGETDDDDDNIGFNLVDVLSGLDTMKVDDRYHFEIDDGTSILFRVLEKTSDEAKLKLISANGSNKATYDPLKGQIFTFKFDISSLEASDMVEMGVNFIFYNESGSPMTLSNVTDWGDYYSKIQNVSPTSDSGELSDTMSKDEIINTIMSNPTLRDTFYKQPKLMGFINAGEPVGIATANQILAKFKSQGLDNDSDEEINNDQFKNIKNGRKLTFIFREDINFNFDDRKNNFTLPSGKDHVGTVRKDKDTGKTYIVSSNTNKKRWSVLLLDQENTNIYRVNVVGKIENSIGGVDKSNIKATIRIRS